LSDSENCASSQSGDWESGSQSILFFLVPKLRLGMPTIKLCLMFNRYQSCFILLTRQAELGNRHSQTGVWEREIESQYLPLLTLFGIFLGIGGIYVLIKMVAL